MAQALRCQWHTVGNVRRRCVAAGLPAALSPQPLPLRAPQQITGEVAAHLLARASSAPPEGQQRWTLRMRADRHYRAGAALWGPLGYTRVGGAMKHNVLNPWQGQSWCMPKASAPFVATRADV